MVVQIEVVKNKEESSANLIRRFTKRLRGSGVMRRARSTRYWKRPQSQYVKKSQALKRIAKQKHIETLRKLGKIKDVRPRRS